ncbi:MAG TPA: hypothetical protein VI029_00945, partial [Mycobacterium sp.]
MVASNKTSEASTNAVPTPLAIWSRRRNSTLLPYATALAMSESLPLLRLERSSAYPQYVGDGIGRYPSGT